MITVTLSWHKSFLKKCKCFFTKFVTPLIQHSSNVQSVTPMSGHGTDVGNAVSTSPAFFLGKFCSFLPAWSVTTIAAAAFLLKVGWNTNDQTWFFSRDGRRQPEQGLCRPKEQLGLRACCFHGLFPLGVAVLMRVTLSHRHGALIF